MSKGAKINILSGKKCKDIDAEGSPITQVLKVATLACVHLTFQLDQWGRWIGHSEPIRNCKFNHGMTPIKAAAPYVVSLIEQIQSALGT